MELRPQRENQSTTFSSLSKQSSEGGNTDSLVNEWVLM